MAGTLSLNLQPSGSEVPWFESSTNLEKCGGELNMLEHVIGTLVARVRRWHEIKQGQAVWA
jgi:hypothetical protein